MTAPADVANDRSTSSDVEAALERPPGLVVARRLYGIAALLGAGALVATMVGGLNGVALPFLVGASFLVWVGWLNGRSARGVVIAGAALQALTRGDNAEAERLHARVPPSDLRAGSVARAIAFQRALLALGRGDAGAAIAAIEPAVSEKARWLTRTHEGMQRASALALRAVAYAAKDDAANAERDAARAEAMPEAMAEALARAALARAILLARREDLEGLARLLASRGSLMLESLLPRERELVRAMRTMARARRRSVYREAAKPTEGGDAGHLADWIAQLAPGAAAFARSGDVLAERAVARAPGAGGAKGSPGVLPGARRFGGGHRRGLAARRVAMIAGLMVLASVATLAALATTDDRPARATGHGAAGILDGISAHLAIFLVVFSVLVVMIKFWRARRMNLWLIAANRAIALGDEATALALTERAARTSNAMFSAAAHAGLSQISERRGAFARALEEADRAIGSLSSNLASAAVKAQLLPPMMGLRAVALAALGRSDEADAEVSLLLRSYPAYAHAPSTQFRVRLLSAVRAGDEETAREVARERTAALPIGLRDDVLADLVLAVGPDPLRKEDRERLEGELADGAELRAWIDAVAPGMRERLAARA